jgi:hypothetical protein
MYIRIENFPAGTTVEQIREFLGDSDEIEEVMVSDAGNEDNVIAMVKVKAGQTGAGGMAEFIDGRFFGTRRLSAMAMNVMNE